MNEHERRLVRYAQHFVGDVERARDVVQDTFVKLHTRYSEDPTGDRLEGTALTKWLYKVCRNRAIDVARKESRMSQMSTEKLDERVDAKGRDPVSALELLEQQQTLLVHIARLSMDQQEVLRLKFQGGLSYQEIADVTGHSRSNVGVLLHTAVCKLRERIVKRQV